MSKRLYRLTLVLRYLSYAALVAFPLVTLYAAAGWLADPDSLAPRLPGLAISGDLRTTALYAGVALGLLPILPALYVLWQMQMLFSLFASGETLTPRPADRIRRIGAGLLAIAGTGILARPLAVLVLSSANPPGQRVLAISVDGNDVALILAGGLMVVLGAVLHEAAAMAEENRSFV